MIKKLLASIKDTFTFHCEREAMGYSCHCNYEGGCETCGRQA